MAEEAGEKSVTEKKVRVKKAIEQPQKPVKQEEAKHAVPAGRDPYDVIRFVLMTEKAIALIEKQNKLVFIVDRAATKPDIRSAVEQAFSAKAAAVQTVIDQRSRKKAFVTFAKEGEAGEIAIRLGII